MSTRTLLRIFPPPHYLALSAVGLDISDQSIKFAELKQTPQGIKLGAYGRIEIPLGTIAAGKITDRAKLAPLLATLRTLHHLSDVHVSLPEEQIYSFRSTLTDIEEKDIRNTIEFSLEEHIPVSAAEATFDFVILDQKEKSFTVQVSATATTLVESYVDVFREAGLTPLSFEVEGVAVTRALTPHGDQSTMMIVDFGETRTGISIVTKGMTLFTSTLEIGGYALTKMIEKEFKISFEQAEKMKRSYGLENTKENRDLFNVLLNGIAVLRDEINKHFLFWQEHKDESEGEHSPIVAIILSGGNANMYGLAEYLSQSLRLPVKLGNTWVNVDGYANDIPEMQSAEALGYATAIGLALGHFETL